MSPWTEITSFLWMWEKPLSWLTSWRVQVLQYSSHFLSINLLLLEFIIIIIPYDLLWFSIFVLLIKLQTLNIIAIHDSHDLLIVLEYWQLRQLFLIIQECLEVVLIVYEWCACWPHSRRGLPTWVFHPSWSIVIVIAKFECASNKPLFASLSLFKV